MTATAVEFDPFSAEYFDDPTEVYRRLRDEAPVYFSETYGFYALSRFADVVAAHRDWRGFSSAHGVDLSTLTKDPELIRSLGMIIMMDPPEHDRFRALVSRVFTPRAVTAPRADGPRGHHRLPRPARPSATRSTSWPTSRRRSRSRSSPGCSACPRASASRSASGSTSACTASPARWTRRRRGRHAMLEIGRLLPRPRRREAPAARPTTCSAASPRSPSTAATASRPASTTTRSPASPALLGGAGAETVTKLVGNAVVLFDRAPRPVAPGRRRPASASRRRSRRSSACCPPSQYQGRFSVEDREYEGGTIPAGYPVLLLTGAATRDPRAFERPDDFDIDRPPRVVDRLRPRRAQLPRRRPRPAWRAASPSRSSPPAGSGSRSTRPACAGSTCRTSPATPTCRSPRCADRHRRPPSLGSARLRVLEVAGQLLDDVQQLVVDDEVRPRRRRT